MQSLSNPNIDNDELDAWLAEVDLVHEKIKKMSESAEVQTQDNDEDFKKLQAKKLEKIRKKEEEKQNIENQQIQLLREGRKGKGEKKDYASFCGFCFREYLQPTEICVHCKRPTMTQEQRYNQLIERVEQMKRNKVRKSEKKQKLELMQKTEKILWKKNSTNYNKWEYYTSSEEELENSEPIVPKDDPNFRALEMDLEERKKRKIEDAKKADELKQKGNMYYNKCEYDHAVWKYSEALELCKDNKALWLNRAIAYIKLKKFRKAIKDCTQILNYAECFEEGYLQSKESCFKAFLRRAMAQRQLKNYQDALNDVNEAINLIKDKEAIHLREEILELIKHSEQLEELKKSEETLPFKEVIDKFKCGKENQDLLQLFKNFRERPDECIPYFQEKDGITKLIEIINNDEKTHDEQNVSLLSVILAYGQSPDINPVTEHFICQKNGIEVLLSKVRSLLKKAEGKRKSAIYDTVQDYIEALNILDDEKIRNIVQSNSKLIEAIYPEFWDRITDLYKDEFRLVNAFLSLCCNLLYGKAQLKSVFMKNCQNIVTRIGQILDIIEPIPTYQALYDSISNLMSNLLTETPLRIQMYEVQYKNLFFNKFLHLLTTKMNQENAMAVLVNLTFQIDDKSKLQYVTDSLKLPIILIDLLKSPNKVVVERSFTVLAKCQYNDDIYMVASYLKEYPGALKVLLQMLNVGPIGKVKSQLERGSELFQLLGQLKNLLFSETELLFCNSCVVIGQITEIVPHSPVVNGQSPLQFFQQIIPHLLTVIRDKRGNIRKNAGILLAKLSKDEKNLQTIRSLHGIEILNSVIGFII